MGVLGQAVNEARASVAVVFRNKPLRRLNLAVAGSMIGDWALATAITVWAYGAGGATLLGVWGAIRVALLALGTPFGSEWANRYPPRRVMVATDLVRAVMTLVAAAFVEWGSIAPVFALAILTLLVGTTFRQAQATMTTLLVESPQQLTSATRVLVTLESSSFIAGPLIAGLLLSVADVAAIYVFRAATLVWSAVMVMRIGAVQAEKDRPPADDEGCDAPPVDDSRRVMHGPLHGFTVIGQNRDLRLVATLYCAQCVLAGAAIVFVAAIAFDLVGLGPSGVGYLEAAAGVGAQVGVLAAIVLGTRRRLATDFGLGALLWALALFVVAVWPTPAAAFITMAVIGLANPIVDINASIILQRLTPQPDKGRVFAALETGLLTSMAFGALAMPAFMYAVGLRWSLIILAVPTVVTAIAALPGLSRLDRTALGETTLTGMLESLPLFHLLPEPMLEALGGQLTRVPIAAGTVIMREGDHAEHFYIIESGSVDALNRNGELVNRMGPGDCFGEIALLYDVPRTLTVVATQDTVLHVLWRGDFIAAVTRDPGLQGRMGTLASSRLQRS